MSALDLIVLAGICAAAISVMIFLARRKKSGKSGCQGCKRCGGC